MRMTEPDTITVQRSAGAVAFAELLKQRELGPRTAASALNAFAAGRRFPGPEITIAHPMVIDWRAGRKRPDVRHQELIRAWAQTRDGETDAILDDPIPETLWSVYRASTSEHAPESPRA